ncbi:hypothetical protein BSK66_07800 [Paenibacillus odorifer]|uniref:Uncharacterized protein n=1 Tax=Paenibacillus odorifer TaxID=189426 RepID=A0A1R0X392_9BACL|nr:MULTISPECIES: hypothetical protein [Paenibacillus]ETT64906.1 hypothetical protein C171_07817 [Paenibacillus sp. FSL H8-237]OMD27463.1 hypothetical protein BJP51_25030 [Paenibacillus odorifer]OME61025.1 hypothetical protein BSK66_07800 [Paenibacillus odorifer]
MTKLNVVIPAVNVMVEIGGSNVEFRKVDRKAQAGDIVKITEDDMPRYVIEGAFYEVDSVDSHGDPQIIDEDGDEYDLCGHSFEVYEALTPVFAEVAAESTGEITFEGAQYRKVNRSAREGDVIILRSAPFEEYDITQGTPYEVTLVDSSDDPHIKDDEGGDYDTCDDVFDVYEKVSAETTVRGVQYLEVKRQARAGETIKMMDDDGADGWAEGDTFIVTEIDSDGDAVFEDNDGDTRYKDTDYYVVLEPVNAEAKAESAAKPKRLTVGDYAKVVNPKGYREHRRGQIVEIFEDVHDRQPFKARSLIDGGENWYCEHEITLATPEEVSAAKAAAQAEAQRKAAIGPFAGGGFAQIIDRTKSLAMSAADTDGYVKVSVEPDGKYALSLKKSNGEYSGYCNADALRQITEEEYNAAVAPKPTFSVGDKIRITRTQANWPVGTVATITEVLACPNHSSGTVRAHALGDTYLADGNCFELLTAEEASAIEKEAQEAEEKRREELKWATIGRKVGEFKRGDIVSFVKTGGEKGVGTVEDSGSVDDCIGVRVGAQPYDGEKYRGVFFDEGDSATLITPVEQRFDTAVKSVA